MKDLSIICVGYRKDDSFHYDYKHNVKWNNLEISDELYQTDIPKTFFNEDGTIKERYYLKLTTKELIYNELNTLLTSIYYIKKDKIDLIKEDKNKLRELKTLKKYYEKYINRNNLVATMYFKSTSKKMKELNTNNYINNDFDKNIVNDVYFSILNQIKTQINEIENKKKKHRIATYKKNSLNKISNLLKQDYENQKKIFRKKESILKDMIKKDKFDDKAKIELKVLRNHFKNKNLKNYTSKAQELLFNNGIEVDRNHK